MVLISYNGIPTENLKFLPCYKGLSDSTPGEWPSFLYIFTPTPVLTKPNLLPNLIQFRRGCKGMAWKPYRKVALQEQGGNIQQFIPVIEYPISRTPMPSFFTYLRFSWKWTSPNQNLSLWLWDQFISSSSTDSRDIRNCWSTNIKEREVVAYSYTHQWKCLFIRKPEEINLANNV